VSVGNEKSQRTYLESMCTLVKHSFSLLLLPITGPSATMNRPLATMWSPNAAGNFSRLQCSDIVSVKLIRVASLKNPFSTSVIINAVYSVCSASAVTLQDIGGGLIVVDHRKDN